MKLHHSNKSFRSVLSLLLALLLAFSVCTVAVTAKNAEDPSPIIYIVGVPTLYLDKDLPYNQLTKLVDASMDQVLPAVKEALPYAAKAIFFGQWDSYQDKAYHLIEPFLRNFALNENGEVTNNSGTIFKWSEESLRKQYDATNLNTCQYLYDGRLSPLEVADDLNNFIETVKRITGKDKISLITRCLGTCVGYAYLYKYQKDINYAGIDTFILYVQSASGVEPLEAVMSGNLRIDPKTGGKFLSGLELGIENDLLSSFLALTMQMLQETYGIELTASFAQWFYQKIKDNLIPRVLKTSFATAPGYWSMVNETYDEAKDYIFSTPEDRTTYAGLIQKMEDYRNNVQLQIPQTLNDLQANDIDVAIICKYGFCSYPVYEDCAKLADGVTGVQKISIGATCSTFDATLGKTYLASHDNTYISPDQQIDSATSLLPEKTWYIKNLYHDIFPRTVDSLLIKICNEKDFNIHSDEAWPQYLVCDPGNGYAISPMTKDNCDPHGEIVRDGDQSDFKGVVRPLFLSPLKYFVAVCKLLLTEGFKALKAKIA